MGEGLATCRFFFLNGVCCENCLLKKNQKEAKIMALVSKRRHFKLLNLPKSKDIKYD